MSPAVKFRGTNVIGLTGAEVAPCPHSRFPSTSTSRRAFSLRLHLCLLTILYVFALMLQPRPLLADRAPCPVSLSCFDAKRGFYSDPPAGHLRLTYTDKGPNMPESCAEMCKKTDGCAYWMYNMLRSDGECKMWSHEQSPCQRLDPNDASTTFFDDLPIGLTVVGGPCDREDEPTQHPQEQGEEHEQDKGFSELLPKPAASPPQLRKSQCPRLLCNSPHKGFLYDHAEKGHLLAFATNRRRRPHLCFAQCMETPGCAFWMFNTRSPHGDCVLWSEEQNPCAPEEGGDADTAHFDPDPPHGRFVVGGYCKMAHGDIID